MLVLGMLCRGLWANTFKAERGKWRFELYCFDFAIGVLVAATIFAFTLGSLGFDGFSVMDDLRLAGKRQEAVAFIAGVVFNLGNMLELGAVSISGLAVAFPIGMGFALVLNVVWNAHPESGKRFPASLHRGRGRPGLGCSRRSGFSGVFACETDRCGAAGQDKVHQKTGQSEGGRIQRSRRTYDRLGSSLRSDFAGG